MMAKEFSSEEDREKYKRKTEYRKGWYKRNKEKCNQYAIKSYHKRASQEINLAPMREVKRKYKAANRKLLTRKDMLNGAKRRARKKNVPFNISLSDISIPEECPLLGIPLIVGTGKQGPHSPSLDRMINSLGYVPGNVWVISNKANICKSNLSADEIILVGMRLKAMIGQNYTGELQ